MIKLFKNLKPFTFSIICIILMFGTAIGELYLPTLMANVVNNGMLKGDTGYILEYGFYMLVVALISTIFTIAGSLVSSRTAIGFSKDLRNMVFNKSQEYSLNEFDKFGVASLITRTTNDIIQVQTVLAMMFKFIFYAPIMCVGGIIMALSKDKGLTIIILVVIPILILIMFILGKIAMPHFKAMQKKIDKINLLLRENLTGLKVIRAFNKTNYERKRFNEANKDLTDTAIKVNRIMAVMQPTMIFIMNATSISVIWFGGLRIDAGKTDLGGMMAFSQYVVQILFSFIMISVMFVMIPRAQASAERINEVLEIEPDIKDGANSKNTSSKKGYVEFSNVSFRYSGLEEATIKNISFSACKGEITAIIGGTGSGKTTLINMIPRFYDVEEGTIKIDDINIKDMKQEELRLKIGLVPQAAVIFSDTIAENIKYGKDDATVEEIVEAAKIAQAYDFIEKMDKGFDSVIAQGGTNMSGGQKQRISIARAIVRKPEIYIFDDSFSALDFKTEAILREGLKKETSKSTVIIVAQRITSIIDADKIIVMDEGRVVGIGTHKSLLMDNDDYKEIVASQLSEEELA
jgi:ATP-binding cassette, subfamily B, multidrug efflux pump